MYFRSAAEFRRWLAAHHATAKELLVGFHKRGSGTPGMTWPESVDEALCVGWIDGVRRRVDEARYTIRFTPRRARSTWSRVNVRRAEALIAAGRMRPAGLAAFRARKPERTGIYSFERPPAELPAPFERRFRRERAAWRFFGGCLPSYRRVAIAWVTGAKQEATRLRRLETLIACCARAEPLPGFLGRPTPAAGPPRRAVRPAARGRTRA